MWPVPGSTDCHHRYRDARNGYSEEFIAADLREALASLDEIVGNFVPEQILDRIFAEFCIGK